jgi:hypothetical protein
MARKPEPSVRDETLRLTLSQQESDYIRERLMTARLKLALWAMLVLAAAGAVIVFISVMHRYDNAGGSPEYFVNFFILAAAIITLVVGVLKLPFAILDARKYQRYRNEHQAFLGKYGRGT